MRKFLIGLVGFLALSSQAKAEASANQFLNNQNPEYAEALLDAMATGISWANSHIDKPMYCPPSNLAITSQQHMEILRQYIQHSPSRGDYPAGAVMIRALEYAFPCKKR